MRSEFKTAIMMGVLVAGIIGVVTVVLENTDAGTGAPVQFEPATLETGDDGLTKAVSVDKSGYRMAPALVGIAGYINTSPEDLAELMRDKVVMYDIWTYSCINCVRTLPYITAWHDRYADQGLVIVGIHSPEFEFEKVEDNVRAAVQKHGIAYPVVMDNDMDTWSAFENRYWPRKYIADHEGYIRYDHIGEGGYDETEVVVQRLLEERSAALGLATASAMPLVDLQEFEHTRFRTPELYLGYELAYGRSQLGSPEGFKPGQTVSYGPAGQQLELHLFYMEGDWENKADHMRLVSDAGAVRLPYAAKQVNIVAAGHADLQILVDGAPAAPTADVGEGGVLSITGPGLYNLVEDDESARHLIEIIPDGPGLELYTFTFG